MTRLAALLARARSFDLAFWLTMRVAPPVAAFRTLGEGPGDETLYALTIDGVLYDAATWPTFTGGRALDVRTWSGEPHREGGFVGVVHVDLDGTHRTRTRAGGRPSQRRRRWDVMRAAFAAWPAEGAGAS